MMLLTADNSEHTLTYVVVERSDPQLRNDCQGYKAFIWQWIYDYTLAEILVSIYTNDSNK